MPVMRVDRDDDHSGRSVDKKIVTPGSLASCRPGCTSVLNIFLLLSYCFL